MVSQVLHEFVMTPLEFMQRLAALVPRPKLNLIRFYGVLVQNTKLRAMIILANVVWYWDMDIAYSLRCFYRLFPRYGHVRA